ncbi:MAG TPA: HIT domain-containing protein [Pyrinomonadaceae bacterium]|nr:HIT domain-containing protein [Pyrinomonadaceae bacterium]
METDRTIVIKHPSPESRIHYVIIPKKDIKNLGEVSTEDREYLLDAFAVVSKIVKEQHLEQYRVVINGPDYQSVTYLHFHLMAR